MRKKSYPDDLTNEEWRHVQPFLIKQSPKGRKAKHSKRAFLNAIFYLLRTGCSWRHLPHDFPPWKSVYTQFRRWQQQGIFVQIHHHLRRSLQEAVKPLQAVVDSQSVKITEKGGSKGTMRPRRSREENDICLWMIKECS